MKEVWQVVPTYSQANKYPQIKQNLQHCEELGSWQCVGMWENRKLTAEKCKFVYMGQNNLCLYAAGNQLNSVLLGQKNKWKSSLCATVDSEKLLRNTGRLLLLPKH